MIRKHLQINGYVFLYFLGYYQAGPMMQALGEACCIQPMPYHFHQQQVKVLVHNPALPALHPFGPPPPMPSIVELPREAKPSAMVNPHKISESGDGSQQQQGQSAQVQPQLALPQPQVASSQQAPADTCHTHPMQEPSQQATSCPNQESLDQKSDIKDCSNQVSPPENGSHRLPKRPKSEDDKKLVCKSESTGEPSAKIMKLDKSDAKSKSSTHVTDTPAINDKTSNLGANSENSNSSQGKSAGSSTESDQCNNGNGKKKKSNGDKSKKSKNGKSDKKNGKGEKKEKKKNKSGSSNKGSDGNGDKKKKKKSKKEGEHGDKPKKKKKKTSDNSSSSNENSQTDSTSTSGDSSNGNQNQANNIPEKVKKKKKKKSKSLDGSNPKVSAKEGKVKKKKVVSSSKKKLSPVGNPAAGSDEASDSSSSKAPQKVSAN